MGVSVAWSSEDNSFTPHNHVSKRDEIKKLSNISSTAPLAALASDPSQALFVTTPASLTNITKLRLEQHHHLLPVASLISPASNDIELCVRANADSDLDELKKLCEAYEERRKN